MEEDNFISPEDVDPETMISYNDAAMILGTTHNYIRMLVASKRFHVVARIWVRKNVPKVYIDRLEVEEYNEAHKAKTTHRVKMTEGEWKKFRETFGEDKIK